MKKIIISASLLLFLYLTTTAYCDMDSAASYASNAASYASDAESEAQSAENECNW